MLSKTKFSTYKKQSGLCLRAHFGLSLTEKEAIDLAIGKWDFIVSYYEDVDTNRVLYDGGNETCALCHFFSPGCAGCFVFKHSGSPYCLNTPYASYHWEILKETPCLSKLLLYAKEEREFLKILKQKEGM